MASPNAVEVDRYALVSSFYGPGAVGGWYLTALACLISFGLHPRKRKADSITVDMIAVLTFPTVAAAHLISQIRFYPTEISSPTLVQKAASVEAALTIVKASWAIAGILSVPAIGFRCVKRDRLLAAVALLCIAAQFYLHFSHSVMQSVKRSLNRSHLTKSKGSSFALLALLVYLQIFAFYLLDLLVTTCTYLAKTRAQVRPEELNQNFMGSRNTRGILWKQTLCLPLALLFCVFPLILGISGDLPPNPAASYVTQSLIPASNTSVKDLDQTVAILAGASVLGFNIYDAANAYQNNWNIRNSASPQSEDLELATRT